MNSFFHTFRGVRRAVALFLIGLTTVVGLHAFPLIEVAKATFSDPPPANAQAIIVWEFSGAAVGDADFVRYPPFVRPSGYRPYGEIEGRTHWIEKDREVRGYRAPDAYSASERDEMCSESRHIWAAQNNGWPGYPVSLTWNITNQYTGYPDEHYETWYAPCFISPDEVAGYAAAWNFSESTFARESEEGNVIVEEEEEEEDLLCDAFELVQAYRETDSWWNPLTYISYLTGAFGLNDLTEIATGLAAGNIGDCAEASGYDLTEIANLSRGMANAVMMGIEDGSVTLACNRLQQEGLGRRPERPRNANKKKYAAYVAELTLYQICGAPTSAPDNSTTTISRRRSIDQPVRADLPNNLTASDLSNQSVASNLRSTETRSATDINNRIRRNEGNSNNFHPPFTPGTTVNVHEVTNTTYFVRFSGGAADDQGRFMMRLDDVQGLTPGEIRDRFAIPIDNSMEKMHVIQINSSVSMISGSTNAHREWGRGGGTQYVISSDGELDEHIGQTIEVTNW